ncbi:glycosyltransferase family 2 protein [Metabacillus halosaccharovorans]|uniref:glycosyltransferase n=1 Tax=Metabacillus halosaccharovorans TaxID=930124 RepID=UPI00403D70BC
MILPTISVIIPVFNVEKYLNRCVNSILNQSFQDIEIILINDGSTDKSGIICDEYAQKDPRIRVIHKKNARVSAARNDGIRMAKGKYVSFIDSDDWIEPEMYQEMVNKVEEYNLDLIMCDYKKKSEDFEDKRTQPIRSGYYSKEDIKNELFSCLIMFEHLEFPPTISNWVCLFNLNFILENNLLYEEDIHYCEDSLFGSKVMYHAKSFYYLKNHYYYNYFYNPNSTTNTYNEKKWNSYLKINQRLIEYFGNASEYDFSRQIKVNMLYFTLNTIGQHSPEKTKDRINSIKQIMSHPKVTELFKEFNMPKVPWKTKVAILLIKFKMARFYNYLVIPKPKI